MGLGAAVMSKHTPGPWVFDVDTRPAEVCTVYHVPPQPTEDGLGQEWLYIRGAIGYWDADAEENLANANLIAAAPDLLEALEIIVSLDDSVENYQKLCDAMQSARIAISKAKS